MTLRTRLILGLFTIAVILVVPLFVATRSLDRLHGEAEQLREGDFTASLLLGRLTEAINDLRSAELALPIVKTQESRESMEERLRTVRQLTDSLDHYELGGAAQDIRAAMAVVGDNIGAEYDAARNGLNAEVDRISSKVMIPSIARAETSVRRAETSLRQRARDRVAQSAVIAQMGIRTAIIGLAVAVFVAAIIAALLTQSVSRPVYELERGMRRVADGDLESNVNISPSRTDEFGRLAASFQDMTRQLAELDKLKSEFVSVASHELKTPINVILGYTQLLQDELYGPLTDKQKNVTIVLEKQTKTLARLVKQLLDVSRFEAGSGKLDIRPTELRGFLHNLEESFQVLADQKNVRFAINMDGSLPSSVYWDADRMNEVLGNLLSNAFKFTNEGGEVELSVLTVHQGIQMEVRDTGAGIPADQVPRIFEKFYQADNQDAASHVGTGLGLAIARQIVEAHGGSISCDSTPGVGTTFSLVMPERAAWRRASAPQPAVPEAV